MITEDRDLKASDIQVLSSAESIAALGWNADSQSGAGIKQSAAFGITSAAIEWGQRVRNIRAKG